MRNYKKDCPAKLQRSGGFTLLEILLVVGIISILAGIVIVAINPSKQLATVRNTERKSDIKQIDSALTQYYIDNFRYPSSLTGSLTEICDTGALASSTTAVGGGSCSGLINLSPLVPTYFTAVPKDPQASTTNGAGYKVILSSGKIGLSALGELGQSITLGVASSTSTGGVDLHTGLVAHYTFNDNVNDSINNLNGTWSGAASYVSSQSGMGKAGSFNGGGDKITLGAGVTLGNVASITFWIKSVPGDVEYIIGADGSTHIGTITTSWGNYLKLGGNYGGSWYDFSSLPDVADGDWHFVVLILNDGDGVAIVDGTTTNFTYSSFPITYYTLGTDNNTQYLNGQLDDVRFYNKALGQDEIDALAAGTEAE